MSDNYIELVSKKKILPKKTQIKEIIKKSVILADGAFEPADAIVFCTGYDLTIDVLEEEKLNLLICKNALNYKFKLLASRCTFHPDIDNMGLVNKVEGLSIYGDEMQAKIIALVASGKLELDKEEMRREIEKLKEAINSKDQRIKQFSYGGSGDICSRLLKEISQDQLPDLEHLKKSDPNVYDLFKKKIYFPANCFYSQNSNCAEQLAREIAEMWAVDYEFENVIGRELTSLEIAKKFNEKFKFQNNY